MGLMFTDIPTDCDDRLDVAAMPAATGFIAQPGPERTVNPSPATELY